jgi:hypothetical protein
MMPLLLGAVIAFAIYRRVRRNIGRQLLSPMRLKWRIGLFAVIGTLVLSVSARDSALCASMAAGIVGGVALGWFGLKHTQFEATPQGRWYTPHTYIGAFVSALFLGRVAYRFTVLYSTSQAVTADSDPFAAYQKSPLTLAIFGVLVGYYVFYYSGVLRHSHDLQSPSGDSPLQG